ncbi:uncharacterized protein LOC111699620 isoform X4 [Eurytemora carolleeae]|uniref:uncharacterized protein LOC111699620 isoform X4 n=1 Tax=Eurytemora carolleeae TaxID=1294199 RepID=UPI000C778DB7|nr:uncharacterized protein LOC111699620 isoform X4 [Eurytemora carolleeae]|eukprot:XP_023326106.1 uncharacterized protein LOC111699620 isoform X4 [Eurytemora affinis]
MKSLEFDAAGFICNYFSKKEMTSAGTLNTQYKDEFGSEMPFHRSDREEGCSRRVYGADSPEYKDGPEWDSGYQGGLNISRYEFLDEDGVPSQFEDGRSQSPIPQSHHRHISSTSGFNMKISIPVSRIYDASSQNSRSGMFPIEQDNSFRRSIDTEDSLLHNHSVSGFKNPYFISQENTSGKRMRSSDIFEDGTLRQPKSTDRQVSVKDQIKLKIKSKSPRKDRRSRSPRSSNSRPRLSSRELNSHSRTPLMDISPQREHRTESLVVELRNRSPIGENTCKVTVRSQINVPSNKKPNKDSQRRSRKTSPRTKSPTRDLLRSPIRNPRKSYIRDLRRSPIRVSKSSSVRSLRGSPIRDLRKLPISDVRSRTSIKDLRNKLPVTDRKSGHDYDQRTKLSCEDRLGSSSKKSRSPSLTKMSVKARLGSPVRKRRSKSLQRKTCRNSSDSSSKRSNDRRSSQRKRSRSPLKDNSLSELLRSARELDYLAKEKNELEKECMEFYQTKPKENEKEPEPRLRLVRVKDISLLINPEPSSKDDMRTNALVGNIDLETNRKGFEILQNESAFEIEDPGEDRRTLPSTRLYPPLDPKADTGSGRKSDDRTSSRYGYVSRKDGKSSRKSPRTLSPGRKRKSSREITRSRERQELGQTEQRKSTSMEKTVFTRLQPSLPREETDLQKKGKKSKKTRWSSGEDNMISGKSRDELILFSKPLPPPKAIILKKMALNIMTSQAANLATSTTHCLSASMAKTPTATLAQTLALAQAAALEKYKPSKEVLVAQMRNKIRNQRSLLNAKVSKSLEIPKLGSSEPLGYPEDIEDTTESSDNTAPAKSLMVHYCDYLRKEDKPLGYCDDMMTTWILAGIQDEKSLREYINMENPRSVDKLRVVLAQLITRIPGARIPKSVNVTDLLDQTIKFFVTENPDLYNNTETTNQSINTEVSFLLDRTESQEPGYYTSEYLGGSGKSSNSQDMHTSHASVLPHSVYTGAFPDKSFPLFGRNIPDSTKPSQPSLGSCTLSFPPPVLAVEGIPRAQSLSKSPFAPVDSKPQAFTSPPPPATLTSQPKPFTVPPPATLTSQPKPFTVPPPATLTSQPKPFTIPPPATLTSQPKPSIVPPPATFTSQSQPFSLPPPAKLTSDPPVEKLTSQPQSYTAPPPVKVTSKPDSYLKTVSRSSKYKPWIPQTRCLRYLERGIPLDENIGSVQSDSNLSSNFTQASNWSSYTTPCSNLQSYSTQGSNLPTYSTQDSNLPSCSTQASNLHSNSTSSYPSSGPNLKTYSTTGSILPNYSTQVSNLPTSSTTVSGKPTYANLFSFSKSITLPPLTMSTESTPRYEACPGKPNTSHLQTVGSTQISYSTPGSTVPSFFNSNTLPKPGGPTQKLFTNSLPQHAYTILQNIFGTDPTFSAKYASLQDLYEYFSKKFSVMTNFGYDGSYIEGLARGGRELLARAGWNISSLRQLWLTSGRDGVTVRLRDELVKLEDCFPAGLTSLFLTNITTDYLEETQ